MIHLCTYSWHLNTGIYAIEIINFRAIFSRVKCKVPGFHLIQLPNMCADWPSDNQSHCFYGPSRGAVFNVLGLFFCCFVFLLPLKHFSRSSWSLFKSFPFRGPTRRLLDTWYLSVTCFFSPFFSVLCSVALSWANDWGYPDLDNNQDERK